MRRHRRAWSARMKRRLAGYRAIREARPVTLWVRFRVGKEVPGSRILLELER